MAPWSPGNKVVVIGAGATRGAHFVHGDQPPLCLPPLNTDFFTQLQRITAAKHERDVANVLEDVLTLYGPNFDLTLEQYFTQLEAMIATIEASSSSTVKFSVARLEAMRTRLLNGLSAVLEQSADVAKANSKPRTSPCVYHAEVGFQARVGEDGGRCIDPTWSLERIIGHLLGMRSDDMTPFAVH